MTENNKKRPYLRGYAGSEVWAVTHSGGRQYLAERIIDGQHESHYVSAHCLACAKVEVLTQYGGKVDLRGWHLAGICGAFLISTQRMIDEEADESQMLL